MERSETRSANSIPNPPEGNLKLGFHSPLSSPNPDLDPSHPPPFNPDDQTAASNLQESLLKQLALKHADEDDDKQSYGWNGEDEWKREESGGEGDDNDGENKKVSDGLQKSDDYVYYYDENDDDDDGGGDDDNNGMDQYPVRPGAEDCAYYMKTGSCKYGSNCKFNHPASRRKAQVGKEKVKEREDTAERAGQTECKYYLRTGGCKFGEACRYNHSRSKNSVLPAKSPVHSILELNFLGLPIRPGEKECPYYMRNGSCKYGANCKFNHPDPTAVGGSDPLAAFGNGGSASLQGSSQSSLASWSSSGRINETSPFVPIMYSPTQGVSPPSPDWNGYQASVYPPKRSIHPSPAYAISNPATETNLYTNRQQQMIADEFPERPGQPECSYFLRTGDCKFRYNCKYHHPKNRIAKMPPCTLSDKGLPLRPDQNVCAYYSRYGICKFGPSCKFDHPIQPSSSAGSGDHQPTPFGNTQFKEEGRMAESGNGGDTAIQQSV